MFYFFLSAYLFGPSLDGEAINGVVLLEDILLESVVFLKPRLIFVD